MFHMISWLSSSTAGKFSWRIPVGPMWYVLQKHMCDGLNIVLIPYYGSFQPLIYTYTAYTYINIYIWGVVNMFSFFNAFFWKRSWEQVWSGPASRSLRFWRGSHHVWKVEDFDATCTIWHLAWSPFLFQVQEATGTRFRTTTKLWLSKKWATNHISHVL
jgi:hypothetical protein